MKCTDQTQQMNSSITLEPTENSQAGGPSIKQDHCDLVRYLDQCSLDMKLNATKQLTYYRDYRRLEQIIYWFITILHYCASRTPVLRKNERIVTYMQDNNVNEDKGGVLLLAAYTIATQTKPQHNDLQTTTPFILREQAKDSYRRLASSTVGFRVPRLIMAGMHFWSELHPAKDRSKNSSPRLCKHVLYITRVIQVRQDIWLKKYVGQ